MATVEGVEYENVVTASEIEEKYGFVLSQAIPVDRQGDVPRIAVFRELNPYAPEQIFCSKAVRKGVKSLSGANGETDVYVRLVPNQWADCGRWRAISLDTNPSNVKKASDMTGRWDVSNHGPIWGILHMERAAEDRTTE